MAITRPRRPLLIGAAAAAAALLGTAVPTMAQGVPQAPSAPATTTEMPSVVEDFSYPGADQIFQERKITLKRGDGHIMLVPCTTAWNIKIESRLDNNGYCFQASAKSGYLALELPDAYGVWTEEHPVKVTLNAEGDEAVVNVPANHYEPVGESGDSGLRSVLVELRVTG